ncbi:MAG TPA: DUF3667 domain-containing protein [Candidatus Acidoferrum sp.]|nr:DUF3667 domain-containing protein [Candidatus Acidoferrum sp.]
MTRRRARFSQCPNCGHQLHQQDNFCPSCGQENHDLHVPFRHLVLEGLEGFIHFDSKSYRTIKALLFKPGFLTGEFKSGRRAQYVPPIRLYVFVSFLFFLVLSLSSGTHTYYQEQAAPTTGKVAGNQTEMNISFYTLNSKELRNLSDAQIDSVLKARNIELTPFKKYVAKKLGRIASGGQQEFTHALVKGVTYMMFVLMPLFALILYIFHFRKVEYYLDCLVFSVHYHSFAFLLFTLYILVDRLIDTGWLILTSPLLLAIYLWFALRNVYRQSAFAAMLRTLAIGILHILLSLFCFLMLVLVNILLF